MNQLLTKVKNFYHNNNTAFWGLILIIVFVAIWYFSIRQPSNSQIINTQFQKAETYKDKTGKDHQVIPNQEVSPQVMKQLVDSVSKSLKGKNIQVITQVIQRTDTVFQKLPVTMDSLGNFEFEKKDAYLTLQAKGNKDFADITLQTVDTITFALTKTKHLFKADVTQIDINNTNPYNKVQEGRSFSIREKKILVSIGPQIGYNPFTQKITIGIGLTLPLINIKSK